MSSGPKVNTKVARNKIFFYIPKSQKLGKLPQRKAVEVKVFNNISKMEYDILGWEQMGMGVFNTAGVSSYTPPIFYELTQIRNDRWGSVVVGYRKVRNFFAGEYKRTKKWVRGWFKRDKIIRPDWMKADVTERIGGGFLNRSIRVRFLSSALLILIVLLLSGCGTTEYQGSTEPPYGYGRE